MNDYYNSLLSQYNSKFQPQQKTPKQIAEEQEIQAYQQFLATKEGIDATGELRAKFDNWLSTNYGSNNSNPSKEVVELKNMVAKQNEVMAAMAKQMETLTNQFK